MSNPVEPVIETQLDPRKGAALRTGFCRTIGAAVLVTVALSLASAARAHDHHSHDHILMPSEIAPTHPPQQTPEGAAAKGVTGEGEFRFRHRPLELPAAVREHLVKAHGGFATDSRDQGGDGSVYFCLRNVGLLRLHADLSRVEVVGGDEAFRNVNVHNAALLRRSDRSYLALPSDQAQRVFLTDTQGKLVRTFNNPYGAENAPAFRVCDVDVVAGTLFAANGYADNVCFAADPFVGLGDTPDVGTWKPLRFGGRGKQHGRFGTAHGITRVPGTNVFTVADRANSRLESFSTEGNYIGGIKLPPGTMPCDIDYHGNLAVVGCLKGPGGSTPAPIYILRDGNVVAELNIGKDLGLPGFTHIHNAAFHVLRREDGKTQLFVLAYAWNPGNFAILEQIID